MTSLLLAEFEGEFEHAEDAAAAAALDMPSHSPSVRLPAGAQGRASRRAMDTPSTELPDRSRSTSRRSSHGGDQDEDTAATSTRHNPELDLSERDQVSRRTFSRSFSIDVAELDLGQFVVIG
jgi:hypothetical protein